MALRWHPLKDPSAYGFFQDHPADNYDAWLAIRNHVLVHLGSEPHNIYMDYYNKVQKIRNEQYKKNGCPIKLKMEHIDRFQSAWTHNFMLERLNHEGPPLLMYQRDVLFSLYRSFMEKMGLPKEVIQRIWLVMVAERTWKVLKKRPGWNPQKCGMILEGLLLKIN
jgi:hypothetical protein